jgi:hypothetical protein
LEKRDFALKLAVTSTYNHDEWTLVVVYGPCRQPARDFFVNWLYDLQIDDEDFWMLVGDFNFYRYAYNMNRSGGNFNYFLVFNNIISHLGLIDLPIKGRSYTWSNMQVVPLLEQIDWFFTSVAWTSQFPSTMVLPLCDNPPRKISYYRLNQSTLIVKR